MEVRAPAISLPRVLQSAKIARIALALLAGSAPASCAIGLSSVIAHVGAG